MGIHGTKTYQLSLLQSKVQRRIRNYLVKFLAEYELSPMEWTLLGYICEKSNGGIKISDIANVFGVEISLITNTLNRLVDKKLVKRTPHLDDQRVRMIQITRDGSILVNKIEYILAENLDLWFKEYDRASLLKYIEVLEYLADHNRQSIR